MKICVVSYHSSPIEPVGSGRSGGMNVFTSNLYRILGASCDIDIFAYGSQGCVKLNPNVRIIHLPFEDLNDFAEEIIHHNTVQHYDLIHTHYWLSGIIGIVVKKELKVPWVHTFHTIETFKTIEKDQLRVEVEEEIMQLSDVIISPTHRERLALTTRYPSTNVITIPHGVDINKFRARVNGSSNLLYVGRIDPIKGLDILLDALRLLKRDLRLDIIGGPSQKQGDLESIKSYAEGLRVHFSGPIGHDQLSDCYQKTAMVILPSYYESFGLVALEAMASARPVIGFQDTCLSETIGSRAGILVERSTRELARTIAFLIDNKTVRHNLGVNGRKNVFNYQWIRIAQDYLKTYEKIIKS